MTVDITKENFDEEVIAFEGKVLVDFWAEWCGPCMMLSPIVDEIAEEYDDIKVCKVNCDEARDLALEYNVMAIPCVIYFENGEEKNRSVGYVEKENLLDMING